MRLPARFIVVLPLCFGILCPTLLSVDPGLSGRVTAAVLNGHGKASDDRGRTVGGGDIWWSYCISTADRSYSVVSRQGPAKTGLSAGKAVSFSVSKTQIFLLNPAGKRISLRIEAKREPGNCR